MLALLSGIMGVVFAAVGLQVLKLALPPDTPRVENIALHGGVMCRRPSLLAGVLSGLAPACNAASPDLQGSLQTRRGQRLWHGASFSRLPPAGGWPNRAGSGGHHRRRSDAAQLVAALRTDPGFRTDRIVSAQISLDRNACAKNGACTTFYQTLLDRAQGLPGVTGTALVDVPLTGIDTQYVFDAQDHPRSPRERALEDSAGSSPRTTSS